MVRVFSLVAAFLAGLVLLIVGATYPSPFIAGLAVVWAVLFGITIYGARPTS